MNIKDVTQVNEKYIFFKVDEVQNREKTTKETLGKLLDQVKSEIDFYERMYKELHDIFNERWAVLEKMPCYSDAELKVGNFSLHCDRVDANCKYNKQKEKTLGMFDACYYADNQTRKYERLLSQINRTLRGM